jgi:hypothetical protein
VHHDHEADGAAKALMKGGDAVLGTHRHIGRCFLNEEHRPLLWLNCDDVGARS